MKYQYITAVLMSVLFLIGFIPCSAAAMGYVKATQDSALCVPTRMPRVTIVIQQQDIEYFTDKTTRELSLVVRGMDGRLINESPNDTLGAYTPDLDVKARVMYDVQTDGVFSFGGKYKCMFYKNIYVVITMKPRIYISASIPDNYKRCQAHVRKHELQHHEGIVEGVKRLKLFYEIELDKIRKNQEEFLSSSINFPTTSLRDEKLKSVGEIIEEGLNKLSVFAQYHSNNFVHAEGNKLRDVKECRYVRF